MEGVEKDDLSHVLEYGFRQSFMKNVLSMSQNKYDHYLTEVLIPEVKEEFGDPEVIVVKKNKIRFAMECPQCGDLKFLGKDYDICNEIKKTIDTDALLSYLQSLTGLEAIKAEDAVECECEDDSDLEDDDDYGDSEDYESYEEDTDIDLDEDYGDGNYE